MELEVIKEKLEKLELKYDKAFADEESMPNDLLDQAERIMVYKDRIIKELEHELSKSNSSKRVIEVQNKELEESCNMLASQNRELSKELRKIRDFLNLEDFECGCEENIECGLCRRKIELDAVLEKAEEVVE